MNATRPDLVVLDMAGTTVFDDGVVERAFVMAFDEVGLAPGQAERDEKMEYVRATMGQSKIVVFTTLAAGDAELGERANDAFERAYASLVGEGQVAPIPGARETIAALREAEIAVVFTTGFAPATRDGLLDSLGWNGIADLALSPSDAGGRGRPNPDLNLTALIRTEGFSVGTMAVVGDTTSDMQSGVRAGAAWVVGVLTGAHTEQQLRDAGASHVIADVTLLPGLLGI